ncbi:MAG: SIP domain-containing protein [Pseudomonadota bacterium]
MTEFRAELGAQIEELVEHFNANHADTLGLIARVLIPRDNATETQIVAVSPDLVTLCTTDAAGHEQTDALPLPQPSEELPGLQFNVMSLIAKARAEAGDRIPVTSMEAEIAHTSKLKTYKTVVTAVRNLTPTMRAITVSGGLETFNCPGKDTFVFVMRPHDRSDGLPADFEMSQWRSWQGDDKPYGAYYTVRRAQFNELELWFVMHGDNGPLSRWAMQVAVGDEVALWGPRVAFAPPPDTSHYLLIGDETALPALSVIVEELAQDVPAQVILEAEDPTHAPEFPQRDNVEVCWAYRGQAHPGTSDVLLDAVSGLELTSAGLFVFGAGETKRIAQVRKYLKHERGLALQRMHLTGYWRRT